MRVTLRPGVHIDIRSPEGVHPVDRWALAEVKRLRVRPGEKVLDLGCGAGLFGLAAARLGAGRVLLTDIDPRAVACSRSNARRNRLEGIAECRIGDFFAPCGGERFDAIIANLPQTPGPACFHRGRWGGRDGALHFERLAREAPARLRPGGRLLFVLIGLADNSRVKALLARRFRVRCCFSLRRPFTPSDYDAFLPGLFDYLESRRRAGKAEFRRSGRSFWFHHRLFEARRME